MEIRRRRWIAWLGFMLSLACMQHSAAQSSAEAENNSSDSMQLRVIDPYAELRSGPGRGYPIVYAVEQGEDIELITRRPDWYEVRTARGTTGWTSAAELSRTMAASGAPADLPSVSFGDYLQHNWRFGLRSGRFVDGELDGADSLGALIGYRPLSWLGLDLEAGRLFGSDVRGDFYALHAVLEPFSHWRLSPFLSAGLGRMSVEEQPKLLPLDIDSADFNSYGIGGNYYLGRNFVVQLGYNWYEVDAPQDTVELESWALGFSAFF